MATTTGVDVKAVPHRTLRLGSLAELCAEINRLTAIERDGALTRSGNWTLGQTYGHLAYWMDVPFDGYPPDFRPMFLIKTFGPFLKKRVLKGPMLRGLRLTKNPEGTFGTDPMPLEKAHVLLIAAIERLTASAPPRDNPVFGRMTHDEWIALNLRHAELHLGYFGVRGTRMEGAGWT